MLLDCVLCLKNLILKKEWKFMWLYPKNCVSILQKINLMKVIYISITYLLHIYCKTNPLIAKNIPHTMIYSMKDVDDLVL